MRWLVIILIMLSVCDVLVKSSARREDRRSRENHDDRNKKA